MARPAPASADAVVVRAATVMGRLVWGFAYGVLNVTTTAYAIGDGQGTGRPVGLNSAVGMLGPALALSVGAWLAIVLGPREVFLLLGAIGLLAAWRWARSSAGSSSRGWACRCSTTCWPSPSPGRCWCITGPRESERYRIRRIDAPGRAP